MPSKQSKSKKSKGRASKSNHAVECSRQLATAEKQPQHQGGLILSRRNAPDIGMSPTNIIQRDREDFPKTAVKTTPTITPMRDVGVDDTWDVLNFDDIKENNIAFDRNFTGEGNDEPLAKSTDSDQWIDLKASL